MPWPHAFWVFKVQIRTKIRTKVERNIAQECCSRSSLKLRVACPSTIGMPFADKIIIKSKTAVYARLLLQSVMNKLFNFNNLLSSKIENQTIAAFNVKSGWPSFASTWCRSGTSDHINCLLLSSPSLPQHCYLCAHFCILGSRISCVNCRRWAESWVTYD